jgi:hypothetical protein
MAKIRSKPRITHNPARKTLFRKRQLTFYKIKEKRNSLLKESFEKT